MKTKLNTYLSCIVSGAILASAGLAGSRLLAADEKAAPAAQEGKSAPGPADMEAMMKKWEESAKPGPEHKMLEGLVGEWDAEVHMWMGGADGPAMTNQGSATATMLMGGRYLREEFHGEMMGKKFTGLAVTGFDNFRKQYWSTWMDDTSTGLYITRSAPNPSGKLITFEGKMDEPMTGQKDKPTRFTLQIVSPDKHISEMHDLTLGDKSKVMEIIYTRKKG